MAARRVLQSARRRKRVRRAKAHGMWIGGAAAALLLVFAGIGYLSHLSHFAITDVVVDGTETVAASAVAGTVLDELSGTRALFFSRRNHFLYPKEKIINALYSTYPRVGEAHIAVRDDNALMVTVTERTPAVVWCSSGVCRFVDDSGVLFADTQNTGRDMLTIMASSTAPAALGDKPVSDEEFDRIQSLRRGIEEAGFSPSIFYRDTDGSGVFRTTGPDIRVPSDTGAQQLIENLLTVTSVLPEDKELEYIDLRFGDHVPYYPQ